MWRSWWVLRYTQKMIKLVPTNATTTSSAPVSDVEWRGGDYEHYLLVFSVQLFCALASPNHSGTLNMSDRRRLHLNAQYRTWPLFMMLNIRPRQPWAAFWTTQWNCNPCTCTHMPTPLTGLEINLVYKYDSFYFSHNKYWIVDEKRVGVSTGNWVGCAMHVNVSGCRHASH